MAGREDADALASDHERGRLHIPHGLHATRRGLLKSALKLLGYAAAAYLVLRLIPSLRQALGSLERAHWQWVVAALALETISEIGFVTSWRAIVDPDNRLCREGRRTGALAAWAQLGGGTLVPGGSLGGPGVGAWIMHRFGMPPKLIAERQFNLSFLNTAVDAIALVIFGVGLATGILAGRHELSLTLLPAAIAAIGVALALLIAHGVASHAQRLAPRHPKIAGLLTAIADAVNDTERLLFHAGRSKAVLGAQVYLWFDVLVLSIALVAVHSHPVPAFAVIVMAYIIGALGGSLPLPASIGTIGGIVGMLIVFGVAHTPAIAAVLVYEAIGLLVPLVGGAIAYLLLRRHLGPITAGEATTPPAK
jgi:MFS family permease